MQNEPIAKVLPSIAFMLFYLCLLAENISNKFNRSFNLSRPLNLGVLIHCVAI